MEYLTGVSGYTKIYRAHKFSQVVTMQAKKIFDQRYNVTWDTHATPKPIYVERFCDFIEGSPGVLATES
jgi:hypothetical protein